jgi:hypothetical protein
MGFSTENRGRAPDSSIRRLGGIINGFGAECKWRGARLVENAVVVQIVG